MGFGLASLLKSVRHGRKGSVVAEFAILTPVLMSILFGIVEMGCVFWSYSAMQMGARAVLRDVAVNGRTPGSATAALQTYLPGWMQGHTTMNVTQSNPSDPANNTFAGSVQVPLNVAAPYSFLTYGSNWTLTANVTVVQELPFDQVITP